MGIVNGWCPCGRPACASVRLWMRIYWWGGVIYSSLIIKQSWHISSMCRTALFLQDLFTGLLNYHKNPCTAFYNFYAIVCKHAGFKEIPRPSPQGSLNFHFYLSFWVEIRHIHPLPFLFTLLASWHMHVGASRSEVASHCHYHHSAY